MALLGSPSSVAVPDSDVELVGSVIEDATAEADTTGAVLYDIDGSGASAAVQFATITGAPTLTNADFVVI